MFTGHDIIVIGASAGGLEALLKLLWDLPQDLPAALFIVMHIPAHSKSLLPSILNRLLKKWYHAYSTQSLLAAQTKNMEEALWSALRALEEKSALSQKMAERARDNKRTLSAKRFQEQRDDCQQRAALIRKLLLNSDGNGLSKNITNITMTSKLTI